MKGQLDDEGSQITERIHFTQKRIKADKENQFYDGLKTCRTDQPHQLMKQSFSRAYSKLAPAIEEVPSYLPSGRRSPLSSRKMAMDNIQFNHRNNHAMRRAANENIILSSFRSSRHRHRSLLKEGFDTSAIYKEQEINTNLMNLCGALLNVCYTLGDSIQYLKRGDIKRAGYSQKSRTYQYAECDRKKYKERLSGRFGIRIGEVRMLTADEYE